MHRGNKLLISCRGRSIALVRECSSFLEIGKGLLGSSEPEDIQGLFRGVLLRIPEYRQRFSGLINSIHMIGMKYPLSVFWISDNRVTEKVLAEPGFHIYSPAFPSSAVIELSGKAISAFSAGDELSIETVKASGEMP
ncbi:MAG: DUF192 domain-containing protein [Anaerolineaceae bacterium]|nr:DUF192 domain-containing protein [Anaerolineaceae bacterium]